MNDASQWRMDIADQIAALYADLDDVVAIVSVGGATFGHADKYSDIDLVVYWRTKPSLDQRRQIIEQFNGQDHEIGESYPDTDPSIYFWDEIFYVGGNRHTGLKLDVNHTLMSSFENMIDDVMQKHDHHEDKLGFINSIQRGYIHYGEADFKPVIDRADQLPLPIAEKIIQDNVFLLSRFAYEMLAFREDWLYFNELVAKACTKLLHLLHAINRDFPPNRYKHLKRITNEFELQSPHLYARLETVLRGDKVSAIDALSSLTNDIYDLIDGQFPQIDTSAARAHFAYERAQLEHPPTV